MRVMLALLLMISMTLCFVVGFDATSKPDIALAFSVLCQAVCLLVVMSEEE